MILYHIFTPLETHKNYCSILMILNGLLGLGVLLLGPFDFLFSLYWKLSLNFNGYNNNLFLQFAM